MKYTKHIIPVFIILLLTAFCASAFVSVPTITDGIGFQYQDITIGDNRIQIGDTNITKEATFVVAAYNSIHKEGADFICDGVADQVEIQLAIDSLPSPSPEIRKGLVVLTEGTFNFTGGVKIYGETWLSGAGQYATKISMPWSVVEPIISVGPVDAPAMFPTISDMYLLNGGSHGIHINNTGVSYPYDVQIDKMFLSSIFSGKDINLSIYPLKGL